MPRDRPDRELDRRIAPLALPALGSIAAEPAYRLADTAIVGHLGRVPLAFWVPVLFTSDAAVQHAATVALAVAALTQPMAALAFVLDGLI